MNGKNTNKKISIFYFLIFLVVTSLILVIYINNIIYVNQLSMENNEMNEEIKKTIQSNDVLRTDLEKLTSFERIRSIAFEKFQLTYRDNSVDETKNIVIKKSLLKY